MAPKLPVTLANIGELKVDWLETDKEHIFKIDVPGLKAEDVSLQILLGGILQIAGGVGGEEDVGEMVGKWQVRERPRGSFLRQFKLPDGALLNELRAEDENGVVTIAIPKKEPLVRTILISSKL